MSASKLLGGSTVLRERLESFYQARGTHPRQRLLDRFDLGLVVALLLIFVVVGRLPFAPHKFGDMGFVFHRDAKALVSVIRGSGDWSHLSLGRAPAPVVYYAVPYLFVPGDASENTYWTVAFAWTTCWMVVSLLLIRRTGELLGGKKAGTWAAILALASPFAVYYSYGISAEPPAYIGVALFAYGWARWLRSASQSPFGPGAWLACGGMALFVLSRLNSLLILPIGILAAAALWWSRNGEQRAEAKFAATCVAITGLAVILVTALIARLPGRSGVRPQESNLSDVLFYGSFQFRTEPWDWRFWGKNTRQGSSDYAAWVHELEVLRTRAAETGVPVQQLERDWVWNDVVTHTGKRIEMALVRALALHAPVVNSVRPGKFHIGPLRGKTGYICFHILLNAIGLLSIFGAIWFFVANRRDLASYWVLWAPWLALLIFHAATYAEPRYMFPSDADRFVLAALAFAPVLSRWKRLETGGAREPA